MVDCAVCCNPNTLHVFNDHRRYTL
ncbi:CPXCG motif-containing cysteine-rich protein [Anaerotruncus colihominis]